jgi:hypothetical protein
MNEGWLFYSVFLGEIGLHFACDTERLMGHKLHPVIAYALGVLAMMVPFTFWVIDCTSCGNIQVAWMLWKTIIVAGAGVLIGYGIDALVDILWHSVTLPKRTPC